MTFLTILGVTEILSIFRLVLERKTDKDIPESSRLWFLENFSAKFFALSDAEDNTSGMLIRGGLADLPLLRTLFAGFPKYYVFMGGDCPPPPMRWDREQVMRGDREGGTKNLWGETLVYRNQISVKSVVVCSSHTFHKNICFTVSLNSPRFCDSAVVNIAC